MSVEAKRRAVRVLIRNKVSERRACQLIGINRNSYRYQRKLSEDKILIKRIKELAFRHLRFGYRRIWAMLRREGRCINHKRVYRIWRSLGLQVKRRIRKRKRPDNPIGIIPKASQPNEIWTYDFVFDVAAGKQKLKMLTLVDEYTRECLTIEIGRSIPGAKVREVLQRVCFKRGYPKYIRSDNGAEFIAEVVQQWQLEMGVESKFIEPGRPWQNGLGESFNGKLRDECLNLEWFSSMREAKVVIESWRCYYNEERPHSSLDYLTPKEYRLKYEEEQGKEETKKPEKSLALAMV